MMAQSGDSVFVDDTRLGEVVYTLKVRAPIWRDLGRLKEWLIGTSWSSEEADVLYLGWNSLIQQHCLGTDCWKAALQLCQEGLRVQVDSRLYPSKQCVLAERKANCILGFLSKREANKSGELILPLYSQRQPRQWGSWRSTLHMKGGWQNWICSALKRKVYEQLQLPNGRV